MSKWTKEKRDKLPLTDFGDAAERKYPVADQDDLDSAVSLIGKASDPEKVKERLIAIAKRKGLKLPDAWAAKMSADVVAIEVAAFDADPLLSDGWVLREGKIFECGDYPDKQFSLSEEEMAAAVDAFDAPVHVGLEHVPNVLDGKLGQVRSIRADGRSLMGTVALPPWLDALLADGERRVSCEWDRATKRLSKLDLVRSPRVTDAALMAAFSDSPQGKTYHGQAALQAIHDHAARSGARCSAQMSTKGELSAMQKVHDSAVKGGAACSFIDPELDEVPSPMFTNPGNPRSQPMSLIEKVRARFAEKGVTVAIPDMTDDEFRAAFAEILPEKAPEKPAEFAETPREKELREKVARLEERDEANRRAAAEKDAAVFAADVCREGYVPPALKSDLAALIVRFSDDDHASPAKVAFSDAKTAKPSEGTRVDALMQLVAKLPKSMHREPVFDPAAGLNEKYRVLFNDDAPAPKDAPLTQPERDAMLSRTEAGRAALAARNGK